MEVRLSWSELKTRIILKDLFIQYIEYPAKYMIYAVDGPIIFTHSMAIDETPGTDQGDFEDNFKPIANRAVQQPIKEELRPTGGHYQKKGYTLSVSASTDQSLDISFPFDISLLAADYSTSSDHEGDQLAAIVSPDTILGLTAVAHSVDDTVITVPQTVIDNAFIGGFLKVGSEEYSRIASIDEDNLTVTIEDGLSSAQSSGVAIKFEARFLDYIYIGPGAPWEVGKNKSGSSFLSANTTIRLKYKNNNGSAKDFYVNLEYLY